MIQNWGGGGTGALMQAPVPTHPLYLGEINLRHCVCATDSCGLWSVVIIMALWLYLLCVSVILVGLVYIDNKLLKDPPQT